MPRPIHAEKRLSMKVGRRCREGPSACARDGGYGEGYGGGYGYGGCLFVLPRRRQRHISLLAMRSVMPPARAGRMRHTMVAKLSHHVGAPSASLHPGSVSTIALLLFAKPGSPGMSGSTGACTLGVARPLVGANAVGGGGDCAAVASWRSSGDDNMRRRGGTLL